MGMVAFHGVVGDDGIEPYMEKLEKARRKIIRMYISKKQSSSANTISNSNQNLKA